MSDDVDDGIDPIIVLDDKHEYFYFATLEGRGGNWMACVLRPKGTSAWRLTYRFRYYGADGPNGPDPFTDEDIKRVYSGTFAEVTSDGEIVKVMDVLISQLVATGYSAIGARPWRRVIKDRSFETLFRELKSAPTMHFSTRDGLDAKLTTAKRGQS
jgi:hypothetical protein